MNVPEEPRRGLAPAGGVAVPNLVAAAGADAARNFLNFFIASIRNPHTRRAADDMQRALEELVRREVEAALKRHGIGSEKAAEPAGSVHVGIPSSQTPDLLQCPNCGYEFRPSEGWSSTTIEGESTGYGTSHTEGGTERSDRSRSHSITSQSTTEGTTETETGTGSLSGPSYPE